jgi:hypothetical protein
VYDVDVTHRRGVTKKENANEGWKHSNDDQPPADPADPLSVAGAWRCLETNIVESGLGMREFGIFCRGGRGREGDGAGKGTGDEDMETVKTSSH